MSETQTKENRKSIFDEFTNKYALSKTLRFELKPVGETLEKMRDHFRYREEIQTFLADQDIEDAYQRLKPLIDEGHEEFIADSLELEKAKNIDFSDYFKMYQEKKETKNEEKKLRSQIGELFTKAGENWKEKHSQFQWKKGANEASGSGVLATQDLLRLIRERNKDNQRILDDIKCFVKDGKEGQNFFTYFGGFNQNRENYYTTKDEKATAVATRIVHENLPKFCDNVETFRGRKDQYIQAYHALKEIGSPLVMKDHDTKKEKSLMPIEEKTFSIEYFSECLSQEQINVYNDVIANANFLVNLYNQSLGKENKDKKLKPFKTLYKQIGCGDGKPLFFALSHYTKKEADKKRAENSDQGYYSVEETLHDATKAGEVFFQENKEEEKGEIRTVPQLLNYLRGQKSEDGFAGVYWSKAAMNTISNRYFANWHDLKDRLKDEKVFKKADKKSDEEVSVPQVIELSKLFPVIDKVEDWDKEGIFFRKSLTEKREDDDEEKNKKRREIIQNAQSPSLALLEMMFLDVEDNMRKFLEESGDILAMGDYKTEESKAKIKQWLEYALSVTQILKYFHVREDKVKGESVDAKVSNALVTLLYSEDAEWFKRYDSIRNFLTKKPQEDAKKNKLKLNFENGSLLGGWSDGQEKSKAAVMLRREDDLYLGILKKKNLFDTENEKNEMYKDTTNGAGRLLLMNLKFQTLAGKGFLGKFGKSYGDMGKGAPLEAVRKLQEIMKERYIEKYPLLRKVAFGDYSDKKIFDKDTQDILKESYVCEFVPISWEVVKREVCNGNLYLFRIHTKDSKRCHGKKRDIQSLYWEAVFHEKNMFQLNGGGEIFYQRQAIEKKEIKKGYESKPWVINLKRFTEEEGKFLFHCPIKINHKAKAYSKPAYAVSDINSEINTSTLQKDILFLGIDRGEKHLAYYSLVDSAGKIHDQGTLNIPFTDKDGKPRTVKAEKKSIDKDGNEIVEIKQCKDYNELLEARAGNRDYARKNWKTIDSIKDLKEGYISQVVRKIVDIAIEKNAFIVLEDLNVGFKRGRQKIEKSVYQKLELALAKKLNFLVDKTAEIGKPRSVTHALQLTPPVNTFGDMDKRKQFGIMFYTRAGYTSQTDPLTGWRKTVYLKKGSEEKIREEILETFSEIEHDGKDYVFTYTEKIGKEKKEGKEWKLYSGKDGQSLARFRGTRGRDKHEWRVELIDVGKNLDGLFAAFDKSRSLREQLSSREQELKKIDEHTAWESLRYTIDVIQNIRNTGPEGDERNNDFLHSPVRDETTNEHFDSRAYWDHEKKGERVELPTSGDANGAYNIARKGVIMAEHIRRGYDDLYITDEEWSIWLRDKKLWEEWMPKNLGKKNQKKV